MTYIDEHRKQFGVEPICKTLHFAPQTYYAAMKRPPSPRQLRDEEQELIIGAIYMTNYEAYGVEKMWKELLRLGISIGRDQVRRLMRKLGIEGVVRGKPKRTTIPGDASDIGDLVKRNFRANRPNELWVTDLTYVRTWAGFVYTSFIIDVFSRSIVGWKVSRSLKTDTPLDALEMAMWNRRGQDLSALIHHSDRGTQYLSVRYTDRLALHGIEMSVGSRGDSYDNALAETVNGLYKAELIHRDVWENVGDVERATASWVHWWNTQRLHSAIGFVPPAEFEALQAPVTPAEAA